jgi:hypothetical protein
MRRLGVGLLPLLAALLLAGCSGAEAQQAQELLERASVAQDALRSASFEIEFGVTSSGQTFNATASGGGYLKGRRAGDMFFRLDLSGVPGAPDDVGFVVKGKRMYVSEGSGWRPVPSAEMSRLTARQQLDPAVVSQTMAALTDSVKDVTVTEGQLFRREPVTVVGGRIDTARLLGSLASTLSGAAGLADAEGLPLDEIEKHVGDLNVSLMLSKRTGLLRAAVISMQISDGGESTELRMIYRLTRLNKPVRMPAVS